MAHFSHRRSSALIKGAMLKFGECLNSRYHTTYLHFSGITQCLHRGKEFTSRLIIFAFKAPPVFLMSEAQGLICLFTQRCDLNKEQCGPWKRSFHQNRTVLDLVRCIPKLFRKEKKSKVLDFKTKSQKQENKKYSC